MRPQPGHHVLSFGAKNAGNRHSRELNFQNFPRTAFQRPLEMSHAQQFLNFGIFEPGAAHSINIVNRTSVITLHLCRNNN